MKLAAEVLGLLSEKKKVKLIWLGVTTIFTAITEVAALAIVIPFTQVMLRSDGFQDYWFYKTLENIIIDLSKEGYILIVSILFGLLALFVGILRVYLLNLSSKISFQVGSEIGSLIFDCVIKKDYDKFLFVNTSEIISAITIKTNNIIFGILLPVLNISSSVVILIFISLALIFINPIIFLICLLTFGGIYFLIFLAVKKKINTLSVITSKENTKVVRLVTEGMGGIRDIILDSSQKRFSLMFMKSDGLLRKSQAEISIISGSPRYILESMGLVGIAIFSVYSASSQENLTILLPLLGAAVLGTQRMLPLLQQIYHGLSSIQANMPPLSDVLKILHSDLPSENLTDKNKTLDFINKIEFDSVAYKYIGSKSSALLNTSFEIVRGDFIGIVGKTGSGKSTMIDILMGLLRPSAGEMRVDNVSITKKNESQWRKNIAHVPQSVFMVDGSILDNIIFGSEQKFDYQRLELVIKLAELQDFITELPEGWNSNIGERGSRLSGGQKQRIGIARALYKEFNILVLDEATNALDLQTEERVIMNIKGYIASKNLTAIMVTHRNEALRFCNKVFKVENSSVIS